MLNPDLDVAARAAEFAHRRRVLVPQAFTAETAERLARCLREEVPWGLATRSGGESRWLRTEELRTLRANPAEWRKLLEEVHNEARSGYQFFYNSYQMIAAYKERLDPQLYLHRFLEFLNSPPMIEFARRVTGMADIAKADAQATRYLPGHFLRRHDDVYREGERDSRRAAYVINLTRGWQADWGGLLQFLDAAQNVEETWTPDYNVLAIFAVPTWHCVSCVAPFATEPRLAITGWFRTH
ncbi:MAG TPA: 2OG-Fe(II) oxygenase family protein [Gammaproteobacteria bacterium]|nr:2OG-Fe(II) oxygenase family protein [Gammaproteobacteria bacterium]